MGGISRSLPRDILLKDKSIATTPRKNKKKTLCRPFRLWLGGMEQSVIRRQILPVDIYSMAGMESQGISRGTFRAFRIPERAFGCGCRGSIFYKGVRLKNCGKCPLNLGEVSVYGADIPLAAFVVIMKLFRIVLNIAIGIGADGELYTRFAVGCLRIYLSLIVFTCVQKVCAIFLHRDMLFVKILRWTSNKILTLVIVYDNILAREGSDLSF